MAACTLSFNIGGAVAVLACVPCVYKEDGVASEDQGRCFPEVLLVPERMKQAVCASGTYSACQVRTVWMHPSPFCIT